MITKSLILPGSGQTYAGYERKGTLITALQVMTLFGAIALANFKPYTEEIEEAQKITITATAAIYIYNIIDAILIEPKDEVDLK